MNTILVLTDFSKKSKYAAETAIQLAYKTNADILLFNAYSRYPYLPSAEYIAWPPEYYDIFKNESKIQIIIEKRRIESLINQHKEKVRKINVTYVTAEGTAAENLPTLLEKGNISIIVIGGRSKTLGNFLFGDQMNQIISKANCPLLIISSKNLNLNIKNAVFATDLAPNNIKAIKYLIKLSLAFHFHLHICHVSYTSIFLPHLNDNKRITEFVKAVEEIGFPKLTYKNIEGTYIAQEIENFCRTTHADLLAIVQKDHSIFHKILQESPARDIIRHQKKPILVLPERWINK